MISFSTKHLNLHFSCDAGKDYRGQDENMGATEDETVGYVTDQWT